MAFLHAFPVSWFWGCSLFYLIVSPRICFHEVEISAAVDPEKHDQSLSLSHLMFNFRAFSPQIPVLAGHIWDAAVLECVFRCLSRCSVLVLTCRVLVLHLERLVLHFSGAQKNSEVKRHPPLRWQLTVTYLAEILMQQPFVMFFPVVAKFAIDCTLAGFLVHGARIFFKNFLS